MSSDSEHDAETSDEKILKLEKTLELINDQLTEITHKNALIQRKLNIIYKENDHLYELIYNLEINVNNLDQYSRRSNIEISKIPEKIKQNELELYVLNIFASIGIKLSSYDIVAVHRLGKYHPDKTRNVIVRFINRKNAYKCLRNSKELAKTIYKKLFISENLCPSNRKIFNYLYKRKKDSKINKVWTFNGSVFMKLSEDGDVHLIYHYDELEEYFPVSLDGNVSSDNS